MEEFEHQHFQDHLDKFRTNVLHVLNLQHYLRLAAGFVVLVCVAALIFLVGNKVLEPPDVSHVRFSTALLLLAIVGQMPQALAELWDLPARD